MLGSPKSGFIWQLFWAALLLAVELLREPIRGQVKTINAVLVFKKTVLDRIPHYKRTALKEECLHYIQPNLWVLGFVLLKLCYLYKKRIHKSFCSNLKCLARLSTHAIVTIFSLVSVALMIILPTIFNFQG